MVILALISTAGSAALESYVLSSKTNLDFTKAGTDQRVGTVLILNPSAGNLIVYLSFMNSCNVEHFRETNLTMPVQSIRLTVNDTLEALPRLWTRTTDCPTLTWSPPGPTFSTSYKIDVLATWNATSVHLAGFYSESISITAITAP
jgi:hypothetical protein